MLLLLAFINTELTQMPPILPSHTLPRPFVHAIFYVHVLLHRFPSSAIVLKYDLHLVVRVIATFTSGVSSVVSSMCRIQTSRASPCPNLTSRTIIGRRFAREIGPSIYVYDNRGSDSAGVNNFSGNNQQHRSPGLVPEP